MNDIVDAKTRSRMMSAIRSKDTGPELTVRRELFRRGFRYRIHHAKLPGRPDIVLPKYRAVIMVNGCFWHGHGCHLFKCPSSRVDFWRKKILDNRRRDNYQIAALLDQEWRVMTVWECALRGREALGIEEVGKRLDVWIRQGGLEACIEGSNGPVSAP